MTSYGHKEKPNYCSCCFQQSQKLYLVQSKYIQCVSLIFLSFSRLETSEDDVFTESRKNSLSEPINNCPHVTVSVTNETSEDLISKENPKIDPEDLDVTDTLDIDPAAYQGKSLFK